MSDKRIVKVQVSQFPVGRVLVYDQAREWMYEGDVTEAINRKMGEEPKRFFWARREKGLLSLDDPAAWQDW